MGVTLPISVAVALVVTAQSLPQPLAAPRPEQILEIYSRVLNVAFSAKGERVLSAHLNGEICWYEFAKKKMEHKRLLSGKERAKAITFAPAPEKLALAMDNQLELWDTRSWRSVRALQNVTGPVAFSRDGKAVAADHKGVLKLWRLE